ncbi:BMY1 [Symbiodinium natans]|uniref:BMY1 protein n=1 Tax=Symbiodinium natans TaxID=878477 RepID=A0A812UR20_9DINO|nr:BMY1 [Symbiodinium natans]
MAAFVSHQWLAKHHPDPDLRQIRILQGALKLLLTSESGSVPLDIMTEGSVPNAKPLPMKDFQAKPLFLWYDYFSVPQLEDRKFYAAADERDGSQQALAINSIPAYVSRCRFFLALCPVVDCPWEDKVLSAASWSRRGWCRVPGDTI